MKRLIVNADDYGLTASIAAGIRRAHRQGILTSTTAMMNMPNIEAELQTALAECPKLGLGVHLVLTAGSPLLPPPQIPSIAGLSSSGSFPKLAILAGRIGGLKTEEVKAEWRAQIGKFIGAAGRPPTHLDSHHHISYFAAPLFGAMLELAREQGCAIRMPIPSDIDLRRAFGDLPPQLIERIEQFLPPMLLASTDVPRPDHFEPRLYGQDAAMLREIIDYLPEGVTEIMCHPGLPDDQLSAITSYTWQRAVELDALTDPSLRDCLRTAGMELITFRELA